REAMSLGSGSGTAAGPARTPAAWRRTVLAGDEAARDEHGDLSGDAGDVNRAAFIERPDDDLLDPADDELGDDLGVKRLHHPQLNARGDARGDDANPLRIDPGQGLAGEPRAPGHAENQARRIGIGKHDRHELQTAPFDECDVLLRRPLPVSGQLEPGPVLDGLDDAAHDALDQGGEDRALVREVLVQRAATDPRSHADVGDGRLVEAPTREDRERAVEDLVAARVAAKIRSTPGSRHIVLRSPYDAGLQELCVAHGCQRASRLGETTPTTAPSPFAAAA